MSARRAALVLVLCGQCTAPVLADPLAARVYDGDTIAPTIRLTIDGDISFDTPEISYRTGAQCDAEIELGRRAKERLRQIMKEAERLEFLPVIDPETGGIARTRGDRRLLFALEADGGNVGHILAGEGLAWIYDWRKERVDWCSTPPVLRRRSGE